MKRPEMAARFLSKCSISGQNTEAVHKRKTRDVVPTAPNQVVRPVYTRHGVTCGVSPASGKRRELLKATLKYYTTSMYRLLGGCSDNPERASAIGLDGTVEFGMEAQTDSVSFLPYPRQSPEQSTEGRARPNGNNEFRLRFYHLRVVHDTSSTRNADMSSSVDSFCIFELTIALSSFTRHPETNEASLKSGQGNFRTALMARNRSHTTPTRSSLHKRPCPTWSITSPERPTYPIGNMARNDHR
ncbi:hypothetical protein B0T20DRAFT_469244 [Sordaria brevicollis]|uniref:Uncharacterized protein n=1 Tax=Sordaria brevicollis TaxID=83679 RepID=A0AAE0PE61_SORBR|nr:hypothetical protein B0T20DRAFT_469244 [Sordaria brevicollis]